MDINGNSKPNIIHGTDWADTINGYGSGDKIFGYGGDDVINGGPDGNPPGKPLSHHSGRPTEPTPSSAGMAMIRFSDSRATTSCMVTPATTSCTVSRATTRCMVVGDDTLDGGGDDALDGGWATTR